MLHELFATIEEPNCRCCFHTLDFQEFNWLNQLKKQWMQIMLSVEKKKISLFQFGISSLTNENDWPTFPKIKNKRFGKVRVKKTNSKSFKSDKKELTGRKTENVYRTQNIRHWRYTTIKNIRATACVVSNAVSLSAVATSDGLVRRAIPKQGANAAASTASASGPYWEVRLLVIWKVEKLDKIVHSLEQACNWFRVSDGLYNNSSKNCALNVNLYENIMGKHNEYIKIWKKVRF